MADVGYGTTPQRMGCPVVTSYGGFSVDQDAPGGRVGSAFRLDVETGAGVVAVDCPMANLSVPCSGLAGVPQAASPAAQANRSVSILPLLGPSSFDLARIFTSTSRAAVSVPIPRLPLRVGQTGALSCVGRPAMAMPLWTQARADAGGIRGRCHDSCRRWRHRHVCAVVEEVFGECLLHAERRGRAVVSGRRAAWL